MNYAEILTEVDAALGREDTYPLERIPEFVRALRAERDAARADYEERLAKLGAVWSQLEADYDALVATSAERERTLAFHHQERVAAVARAEEAEARIAAALALPMMDSNNAPTSQQHHERWGWNDALSEVRSALSGEESE